MITMRNLSYRYAGAMRDALRGVTLTIPGGSFVAIMGANGSGKSTLALCLNGILRPSAGEIQAGGRVGLVFQNPHAQITSLTVEREIAFGLQNLQIGQGELHAQVEEELARSGLAGRRSAPPRSLSGGEQQRLALSSVLVMKPSTLILDEATSLLAPGSRAVLLAAVRAERERSGMTVLLITQFAREALEAERLIVLHEGAVALDGPPGELFSRAQEMSALGLQVPLRFEPGMR
jgi:energy-coupling factor transporter ATP-binding protein EcfA2